jgi:hypothetical protein
VQENAELLTSEGQLLASVQGRDAVDYDISEYASQLQRILEQKLRTTQVLLKQLKTFREHLAIEEEVSRKTFGR